MIEQANIWERPRAQICPECGGAMRREETGTLTQYRCHIGHSFTGRILAEAQLQAIDNAMEAVFRGLKERIELCRDLAAKAEQRGAQAAAQDWQSAALEARQRAEMMESLVKKPWTRPEAD
jgi:two-component system, chemotaxis family, protein-glutamate methylesterase/glutaminase